MREERGSEGGGLLLYEPLRYHGGSLYPNIQPPLLTGTKEETDRRTDGQMERERERADTPCVLHILGDNWNDGAVFVC